MRACRYHPLGNRSNAGVRGEWGEFKNYRDYLDAVNNGLLIVPMIETNQSLENLDAIASVPGVDVLQIGPFDRAGGAARLLLRHLSASAR